MAAAIALRRLFVAAGAVTALVALSGCAGSPRPVDQVDDVTAIADHMIAELEDHSGLRDVQLVGDESEPVPCASDGERYRRVVVGETDESVRSEAEPDAGLDNVTTDVYAAIGSVPVEDLTGAWEQTSDDAAPVQLLFYSDEGDDRGASVAVELLPGSEVVTVRLEVSTACG